MATKTEQANRKRMAFVAAMVDEDEKSGKLTMVGEYGRERTS